MSEDLQELQSQALADLSSLGRVSHRLAMTEGGAPLEKVLGVLLPRMLTRIGSNHSLQKKYPSLKPTCDQIHAKLVEMLSHIMKRVRSDQNCRLPCSAILLLLYDPDTLQTLTVDAFTLNLALAFLTLGLPRLASDSAQVEQLLPGLLVLLGAHHGIAVLDSPARKSQSHQVAHLLLKSLEMVTRESSNPPSMPTQDAPDAMQQVRHILQSNQTAAAALFDLLLDALLYQPSSSASMPPPGLSQAGHEQLLSPKDWKVEMIPRLKDFKLSILHVLAPSKRWAIYMSRSNTDQQEKEDMKVWDSVGLARTVALLVAASGDAHSDVSERAAFYLKAHLDTLREHALGDMLSLSCSLLSLCVGDGNAENALNPLISIQWKLGTIAPQMSASSQPSAQIILSTKRRMASEKTSAAIMTFLARALDENPHCLSVDTSKVAVGTLAVLSANTLLLTAGTSVLSTLRAAPYIAASQLLNSLCVRLTAMDNNDEGSSRMVTDLLAKSLETACSVLSSASSPRPTATPGTYEGSITMRDACYGVLCALSRSRFALANNGFVFKCGATTPMEGEAKSSSVSIETATLLFGCAANEEETLRPRAVAALDALLAAYCRVYTNTDNVMETGVVQMDMSASADSNPWNSSVLLTNMGSDAKPTSLERTFEFAVNSESLSRALLPLLWSASQSSQPKASRVGAARWSSDLLKTLDLPSACHILCFLAGDVDVTASSIARAGLGLDNKIGEPYDELTTIATGSKLPDFSDLTMVLFPRAAPTMDDRRAGSTWRPRYFDFSYHGKAAALRFGLVCLLSDLYGGEDDAVAAYVNALSETLILFGSASGGRGPAHGRESIDLLDECAICLAGCLSTSQVARSIIVSERTVFGLRDIEALAICADSSKARRYLAESCGHIYEDATLWSSAPNVSVELDEWVEKCQITHAMALCARKLTEMQRNLFMVGEVHGAAFLGARCVRGFRLLAAARVPINNSSINQLWVLSGSIIAALGRGTMHSDEVIGNAFAHGLSIALSYDDVDSPILDQRLYAGTASALSQLDLALRKYGSGGDNADPTRASSLAQAAGVVLAASTSGAGYVAEASSEQSNDSNIGPARIQCVDALFSLLGATACRKDPEVALVIGEAFATYADAYSPTNAVWSTVETEWPETYSDSYASNLPPHQHVLYVLMNRDVAASNPQKRISCAPALLALVGRAARMVNGSLELANRALVKEILNRIAAVQNCFITLLADPKSKQLTRESCCLGLAACQGLVEAIAKGVQSGLSTNITLGEDLNESLLRAFGQTTNFGGSAFMESRSQEAARRRLESNRASDVGPSITEPFGMETEVGGTSGLGEAALGAYREMASAALSLGRSDVLYALFLLSVSHPVWFTPGPRDRYGAASLLGENSLVGSRTNSTEMRNALRPHLGKLIPRLLRACHDPNKQTRDQMGTLWLGLTGGGAEARNAITEHLLPTIDALIDDASNKLWRARVGALGALSEVIVGRSWDELGGGGPILDDDDILVQTNTSQTRAAVRLLRLWRVVMRALDDVRIAVRESGEALARSVRALTIRLCDPASSPISHEIPSSSEGYQEMERNGKAAAETALRWLVKYGLNQPCAEATAACISCLLGIVEVAHPATLHPVLSELIGSLLMALSGLEPAALNYLQVRSSGPESSGVSYERLERVRLQMAQSGPIAGALTKCLDMMPSLQLSTQKELIPHLDSALRCGAGFATRAATADAVSTLCGTCPGAFKFPGNSTANPTVRLLRALYFASEREHGQGARDKMAHALGNLAAIAPAPSVRTLALRACERYCGATGNNDDPTARRAAAAALRAMAVRASAQFADGGPNDIWCKRVLPMAFLGKKDNDNKVSALWKEVWDEGGTASNVPGTSTGAFGVTLEEKLLPDLVRTCVDALNDVAWSRRKTACTALMELCDLNVLAPVVRSSLHKDSVNPTDLTRARRRAQAARSALTSCVSLMMKPRIWTGKSELINAAVKLVCKWAVVSNNDDPSVFGSDDLETSCSWIPIIMSHGNSSTDLFVGDDWFGVDHSPPEQELFEVSEATRNDVSVEPDSDSNDDARTIDFEEGEKILGNETADPENGRGETGGNLGTLSFAGFCRALLAHGLPTDARASYSSLPDEVLPYRASALKGLSDTLNSLEDASREQSASNTERKLVYRMIAPVLIGVIDTQSKADVDQAKDKYSPPLIVARSVDCLAASMWYGIGLDQSCGEGNPTEDVLTLSKMLMSSGGDKQPAWTVRESSLLAAATLASKCHVKSLLRHETVPTLIDMSVQALKDRKFWRVRHAGLTILHQLVTRAGSSMDSSTAFSMPGISVAASAASQDRQLVLEALLPHKETILRLARTRLADSESQVTAIASDVCSAMVWWP